MHGDGTQLIKNVIRALSSSNIGDSALLQQVRLYLRCDQFAVGVKSDSDELAEARAVVVADSFRISECFEQWVALQHLALNAGCTRTSGAAREGSEILHNELGCLGFSRARLA